MPSDEEHAPLVGSEGAAGVSESAPAPSPVLPDAQIKPARQRGAFGRAWAWFWRSTQMRDAARPIEPVRAELVRRARVSAEIARRAAGSSEPFEGRADFALCDLYRQSIRWSLRAAAVPAAPSSDSFSSQHWDLFDQTTLLKAAGNPEALSRAKLAIEDGSAEKFAELPPAECANLTHVLASVARALLSELELSRRVVDAIWLTRLLRLALVIALVAGAVASVMYLRDAAERRRDLAPGKSWRASSAFAVGGCRSPAQKCEDSPDYFVHTLDELNPWIEFDLGSIQTISGVRVINRKDCCVERTSPLVVEVSTDDQNWKPVARRDAVFSSWLASFPPTRARWVRLRVEKKTMLHLLGVRILR